jgi:hypothetical protein
VEKDSNSITQKEEKMCGLKGNSRGVHWVVFAVVLTFVFVQPCFSECEFDWKPGQGLSGINGVVLAMTVWDPDGAGPKPGLLVAGGQFTVAGGVSASRIAAWDGNSWRALGSGMDDSVFALTVYDGELVAGGRFTTAGGLDVSYIAAWDGNSWHPLGGEFNDCVWALTVYDG